MNITRCFTLEGLPDMIHVDEVIVSHGWRSRQRTEQLSHHQVHGNLRQWEAGHPWEETC